MKIRIIIPEMKINEVLSSIGEIKSFREKISKRKDYNNGWNDTFYYLIDGNYEMLLTSTPS